jgi:glycosyltransferase involved in cell wall biosynthesis
VNYQKTNTVTAVISTKNRYHTTLPLVVLSAINQSHQIDRLIIFDDGDHKDLREDPLWKNIFTSISVKGIDWEMVFSPGKGQVLNHQKSIEMCKTDWIWRLDDDNYAEYNVLEELLAAADEKTGAVGGLVLDPKMSPKCDLASNKIEDIYLGLNEQWFKSGRSGYTDKPGGNSYEVDHLYSTFIYRKNAATHGYCPDLSVVGHREETIFTYEMKRAGWKIKINPSATTWHYKNSDGGIRTFKDPDLWAWDDTVLAYKMKKWGIQARKPKMVVLDSGLGDHLAFKNILPELKAKYKDIILAICYPEVFEDEKDCQIVSIDAAKAMGPIDEYNVYKKMWDWDHKISMVDAYRRIYL